MDVLSIHQVKTFWSGDQNFQSGASRQDIFNNRFHEVR